VGETLSEVHEDRKYLKETCTKRGSFFTDLRGKKRKTRQKTETVPALQRGSNTWGGGGVEKNFTKK